MIEDQNYSVTRTGPLYKLKSIKGTDNESIIIDLKSGNYSSVSEKHNAMIRIKSTGTCVKNWEFFCPDTLLSRLHILFQRHTI